MGPSRLAARLLFLVTTISSASTTQAACQSDKATDDGDYKITVANVVGGKARVVVLSCARVFCEWPSASLA
jgi:hypothetical protein